ncbi:unnamed protein product [Amoebophrya sp. A25]|nr:unnamed protein product [Amoebophrya sp. A25]|eukprot:GSA25T00024505001.1
MDELKREDSITMTPGGFKSASLWPFAQHQHRRASIIQQYPYPGVHHQSSGSHSQHQNYDGHGQCQFDDSVRATNSGTRNGFHHPTTGTPIQERSPSYAGRGTDHLNERTGGLQTSESSSGDLLGQAETDGAGGDQPQQVSTQRNFAATARGRQPVNIKEAPTFSASIAGGYQTRGSEYIPDPPRRYNFSLTKLERLPARKSLFTPFTREEHAEHYKYQDRLVPRDSPFCQSLGNLVVERQIPGYLGSSLRSLYYMNLFHSLLDFNTRTHVVLVSFTYTLFWMVIAVVFLLIDESCKLDLDHSFTKAYILSVETFVTIGYGLRNDPYLNGCWEGAVVLSVGSLVSMILDGILIGLIFMTLTNPQRRAATVVFTDKAIIKLIDGSPHLVFQVAEIRKQSLLDAKIRCYCFKHCEVINPLTGTKSKSRVLQQFPMRLQSPDDELGGMLFLATPFLVVHRIDQWSPLFRHYRGPEATPPDFEYELAACAGENSDRLLRGLGIGSNPSPISEGWAGGYSGRMNRQASGVFGAKESLIISSQLCARRDYLCPPMRMCDIERGAFMLFSCPYCGEMFNTKRNYRRHLVDRKGEGIHPTDVPDLVPMRPSLRRNTTTRRAHSFTSPDDQKQINSSRNTHSSLGGSDAGVCIPIAEKLHIDISRNNSKGSNHDQFGLDAEKIISSTTVDEAGGDTTDDARQADRSASSEAEEAVSSFRVEIIDEEALPTKAVDVTRTTSATTRAAASSPLPVRSSDAVEQSGASVLNVGDEVGASDTRAAGTQQRGRVKDPDNDDPHQDDPCSREQVQYPEHLRSRHEKDSFDETRRELRLYDHELQEERAHLLSHDYFEILVLVEGVEPFTSSMVQARHSYAFGQDIVLNGDFMPCTFLKQDGSSMVDFGKFHQVVQADATDSARTSSSELGG